MTRSVTQVYGITQPVPFLDVNVDSDNQLFLDPNAIRNGGDTYSRRGHDQLVDFFSEVLMCARSNNATLRAKGERLLQSMHEPNETRLGYTRHGSKGHGFAEGMGTRLWSEIRANPTLHSGTGTGMSIQAAVLLRLERVPLFIKRVDRDMISDLTTRITFNVLADFTTHMMSTYPTLANGAVTRTHDVWDNSISDLTSAPITLPAVDGKQLLLVPTYWVFWRLVMDPESFYNRYATQVIQDEQTIYGSDGKPSKPTKASIKNQNPDHKGTNVRQATKYAREQDRDLAGEYEAEIDELFEPMDVDEIQRRLPD